MAKRDSNSKTELKVLFKSMEKALSIPDQIIELVEYLNVSQDDQFIIEGIVSHRSRLSVAAGLRQLELNILCI